MQGIYESRAWMCIPYYTNPLYHLEVSELHVEWLNPSREIGGYARILSLDS